MDYYGNVEFKIKDSNPEFPEKTLTAGNWGHFEPKFCYQERPTYNVLDSIDKDSPTTCNACHMMCSSHSAWERCQKCLKNA